MMLLHVPTPLSNRVGRLSTALLLALSGALAVGTSNADACTPLPPSTAAHFSIGTPNAVVGTPVAFDASTSEAGVWRLPVGPAACGDQVETVAATIAEYRWDFDGDGVVDQVTTTPTTTHIYNAVGLVHIGLTVMSKSPSQAEWTSLLETHDLTIAPTPVPMTVTDQSSNAVAQQHSAAWRKRRAQALRRNRANALRKRRAAARKKRHADAAILSSVVASSTGVLNSLR